MVAGRYRVEDVLVKGPSMRLVRVTDTQGGGEYLLKRLASGASARAAAQFELEYQTLAGLKHPRVVEVFAFGRDAQGPYYTMPLPRGESLGHAGLMPYREVCGILRDAAEALSLLHARRLLCRDVCPRALRRTPEGRIQLSDLSGLAAFGPADQVIGTPPYVSPEALAGEPLDERSDLYALGATAYLLLTGSHGYPASDLRGLSALWKKPLTLPSARVARLELSSLEPIPEELDALVIALLSPDPSARPASAEEVIARLDALVDAPAAHPDPAQLKPTSAAFVGRESERRTLRRLLALVRQSRGQSCIIEASPGLGRTRLLRELAHDAEEASAIVLHIDASWCEGSLGVASALAQRLLDLLPTAAPDLAGPHAALLAQLSAQLRSRLMVELEPAPEGVERRLRVQNALSAWLGAVAHEYMLVLLIDGLELADDESIGMLLALARERQAQKLLMVCTTRFGRDDASSAAERALAKISRRVVLRPLEERESFELLRSMFGEIEHLGRFAHRLHGVARGNPDHLLELCGQLMRRGQLRFDIGAWVLPPELSDSDLASSRDEAVQSRLLFLSAEARALGRRLSVHPEALSLAMAHAVAASGETDLFAQLGELTRENIVVREVRGLRFSHELLRRTLRAELAADEAKQVQRALGRALLATDDVRVLDLLHAGLYLLESGEPDGTAIFTRACEGLALREYDALRHALPALERGLAIMRARGEPNGALVQVLAPLAIAGYYVDFRYASRYGDESVARLSTQIGLPLAASLRRYVGRRLGLWTALIVTALRARLVGNATGPGFRQALVLLFNCVATLAGSSAICGDPERASKFARALEPLTALGSNHVASLMYEFCSAVADTVRDAFGSTLARFRRLVARLDSPHPISALSPELRRRYLAGALYATGSLEALRDGDEALKSAERLDQLGLHVARLSADQVRTMHHAYQGNLSLFERYRELAEQHAIQMGTTWQTALWSALRMINAHIAMHDAAGLARVIEQLEGLREELPSVEASLARARAAHAVIVGRPAEALPVLEPFLTHEPRARSGWGTSLGVLALAHNELGQHERARAACLRALAHLDVDDLSFPAMNLIVQCELSVAQAGLGEVGAAREALRDLIAVHHLSEGALTMGRLFEAGVRIELAAGRREEALLHLEQAKRWYLPTGVPSLAARCEQLARQVSKAV